MRLSYAAGRLGVEPRQVPFGRLIALDQDESDTHLAANVLWLDNRRVVSAVKTKKTNALLRKKGYEVIELDFSDLVNQWGSFRCVVCPIDREPA